MPRAPLAHPRQEREDQLERAEVVQLHRALVVVEAVVGGLHRAPDRAAGVVDEHVHAAVLLEHLGRQAVHVVEVGEVGRVHVGGAARVLHLLGHLLELLARARDEDHLAAGLADLHRGLEADAARGAGDQDPLALDRAGQAALAEQVRVEVALPVVPQLRGVGAQRRHRDARARERALGVARVELAVEVAVLHRGRRDPQVVVDLIADPLDGGQRHQPRAHRLGDGVRHVRCPRASPAAARGRPSRTR